MIRAEATISDRICQGDIYKDVEYIEYAIEESGDTEKSKITFPLVIVLTQDCDLKLDNIFRRPGTERKTQDKYLLSVLVAPVYNAKHVFEGTHLSELGWHMEPIRKTSLREYLMTNQRARYHYLEFPKEIQIVPSVIDFKHYFSVNVLYLGTIKNTNFKCKVTELYKEDISQRFSSFLSRIALP